MKRIMCVLLAVVMLVSLCACGSKDDGFETEHSNIIEQIEKLNEDTSYVASVIYTTWSNVGVSDFNTFFGALCSITEGTTLDTVKSTRLGAAACCIDPNKYYDDSLENNWNLRNAVDALSADESEAQRILDACIEFTTLYNSLEAQDSTVGSSVKTFETTFSEKHSEETDNISDWYLESSMYVAFVLEPSGSLIEFGNKMEEYEEAFTRFSKVANY